MSSFRVSKQIELGNFSNVSNSMKTSSHEHNSTNSRCNSWLKFQSQCNVSHWPQDEQINASRLFSHNRFHQKLHSSISKWFRLNNVELLVEFVVFVSFFSG